MAKKVRITQLVQEIKCSWFWMNLEPFCADFDFLLPNYYMSVTLASLNTSHAENPPKCKPLGNNKGWQKSN